MSTGQTMASQHVYHQGFPLKTGDRISIFHRLTRTRVGIVLFLLYVLGFIVFPISFVVVITLTILRLRLMRHVYIRRFYDWGVGRWLLLMAVSSDSTCTVVVKIKEYVR